MKLQLQDGSFFNIVSPEVVIQTTGHGIGVGRPESENKGAAAKLEKQIKSVSQVMKPVAQFCKEAIEEINKTINDVDELKLEFEVSAAATADFVLGEISGSGKMKIIATWKKPAP